jgi:hypothetical protein
MLDDVCLTSVSGAISELIVVSGGGLMLLCSGV